MGGRKKIVAKSTKSRKRQSAGRNARAAVKSESGGKARREKAGSDKAGSDKAGEENASKDKAGSDKAGEENASKDKASDDKAGGEKVVSEKVVSEKAISEKAGGEKAGGEKAGPRAKAGGEKAGPRAKAGGAKPSGAPLAPLHAPSGTTRVDRSKRLLDLVMLLLRTRTPVTFRDIRAQFESYQTANVEAGLRAFERDKADLLELGVPIRYITPDEDDSLEEGGYVIDLKRFRLPEVHLTPEEVSALVLAASIARAVPGEDYARVVDLALKKLAFDVPDAPDTPTEWPPRPSALTRREPVLVHFPSQPTRQTRELGDRFAELETATRNRKRVTFQYRSASTGYARQREVNPYGLFYRDGSWLLVGHCHLRKDVRSFRLDRMSDLAVAPKPKTPDFERPRDFDIRAYANRSPWTFRSAPVEEVELEIRLEAAAVANEDFGPDATRADQPDGAVRLRFSCGNPEFAMSRILAAKGAIRVRSGGRLLQRLRDELSAVADTYSPELEPVR
jgi:proteasome accessory factor B